MRASASDSAGSTAVSGESPRRDVVVLGMHRSGTSLTARLLGDLGWYLGRPDELLGPREDNPEGFFERADVQVLNDRLLSRLGASWDGPPGVEELDDRPDGNVDEQLATLVAALEADAGAAPFALKDPRLCVLWPLWKRHLPTSAMLVLTFRHPAEVAASLQKRDGLPVATGLALWEEYVRRALVAAKDRAAVVVRYGDLVARPEESIESLAEALGATAPSGWVQAVRPELYRNRRDTHEESMTASQRELWSWIEAAPTSFDRIDPEDVPGRTEESSIELIRNRREWVKLQAEADLLRRSFTDVRSELDRRAEHQSTLERTLRETHDENALETARRDAQAAADQRDELGRALRAATVELAVVRNRLRHEETARAREEAQSARDSARSVQLINERKMLDQLVETIRQRRIEQSQLIEDLRRDRDELTNALAEKDSLMLEGQAREQVLLHERHHLLRAVAVVEAERRFHEAVALTMGGSRTWRWGRRIAKPLRWMSPRGEEA